METSPVDNEMIHFILECIERHLDESKKLITDFKEEFPNNKESCMQNTFLYNNILSYVYQNIGDLLNNLDYAVTMGKHGKEHDDEFYKTLNTDLSCQYEKTEKLIKEITPYILKKQFS